MAQLQYAGEFTLEHLELISSSGVAVNLITSCLEINIMEDITVHSLSGQLVVADTNDLRQNMPLLGQEQLLMKISTPSLTGEEVTIDYTKNGLVIYNVSTTTDLGMGATSHTLEFCSQELLTNNRIRISRAFKDTPSDIVKKILTESRYIDTKKNINIEITSDIKNIVVPNQRPFDFISNLMKDARSKDGSPHYLFYETTRGYNFRTLQNLYEEGDKGSYHNGDAAPDQRDGSTLGIQEAFDRVVEIEVKGSNDSLMDSVGGMLGSKIVTHDLFQKKYSEKTYEYFKDFDKHGRIDSFPKYNENVGEYKEARIFVHPTSSRDDGLDAQYVDENNINDSVSANKINETLLQRKSRIYELEFGRTIAMSIHGTTNLAAGDMISLSYFPTGKNHSLGEKDSYISGRYIITKLRHIFSPATRNHLITMIISKDSLPKQLEIISQVPQAKKDGAALLNELNT